MATIGFVFAVVATPREALWAFVAYALILMGVARIARIPFAVLGRRLTIELPFVAFALLLPFIGQGPNTTALGMSLSEPGLWGAWNIVVKGTLGVAASAILVATTNTRDLLHGLERLHVPRTFTAIMGFMIRYGELTAGEFRAMHVARISRGHDPHWIWQARAVAATAGTLFIRSYERGERVYLAMASRGYGAAITPAVHRTRRVDWMVALALPAAGVAIAVMA